MAAPLLANRSQPPTHLSREKGAIVQGKDAVFAHRNHFEKSKWRGQ